MATSTSTKTLLTLVAPAALVLAVTCTALLVAPASPLLGRAADGYPLVVMATCVLLAWRLQRSRLLILALLAACAAVALEPRLYGSSAAVTMVVATTLPLGLALLSTTADRPISAPRAYLQLLLAALPTVTVLLLLAWAPGQVLPILEYDVLAIGPTSLSQVSILAGTLAVLVAGLFALLRRRPADAGLAWALLAVVIAFNAEPGTVARDLWLLAAGVVLLVSLMEAAYAMAFHDDLTSLPGRRALNQLLASVRAPYTVAVVDVDHFKSFNDRYGHDVGDQVLRMVASRLGAVGGGGRAFRSGGEEFTIVFPGKSKAEALPHVQAVRESIEQSKFTLRTLPRPKGKNAAAARGTRRGGGRQLGVTISAGLASYSSASEGPQAVVKSADKAMYRAKKNGRNRVVA
ncbi:MAG TPA: GGDEF domain-containing protein [Longimicrobiales bacterium]|nr:GGDEF domain-containing protein [Longimicrobiales bacterium]